MIIRSRIVWQGKEYHIEYHDADSFDDLPRERITQVYGICFRDGALVIGRRVRNGSWGHLGGHPEEGETLEQALRREIQEESNMDVKAFKPIGYQTETCTNGDGDIQLRYCCIVEPFGPFVCDPDLRKDRGGIDAIKIIDPKEYKRYVQWGEIGDRLMDRAIHTLSSFQ